METLEPGINVSVEKVTNQNCPNFKIFGAPFSTETSIPNHLTSQYGGELC